LRAIPALVSLLVLVRLAASPVVAAATGTVPSVQLLVAPDPGDSVYYVVPFSWKGTDSDGTIDHYRVAIDPTPVDSFWFETTQTQRSFFFLSNQIQTPMPGSGPVYFFGGHTLAVEAVDNEGMASAPASRSFVSYTVAPEVSILSPAPNPLSYVPVSPNAVHIVWSGVDWDGVFSPRPVKYKYKLFSQNSFEINWNTILANPDSLRRQYAPAFAGWDSLSADTGSVDFSNLILNNQYLFCVVGIDEVGAYSPRFSIGGNMLWMQANDQVSVDAAVALSAPRLEPPRPNPAGAIAAIDYLLPREGPIDLEVFDAGGRRLRTLATGTTGAGAHRGAWDLRDDRGRRVTPGLYLVRLRTQGATLTRKLVVAR
jgi:flagellar hook capping protein FlgD